jgi:Holliday junction DNA helicase RuvA
MIFRISGILVHKDDSAAVIETSGISYELSVSRRTSSGLPEPGEGVSLFTRMIVREDDISLVGFSTLDERRLYDTLLTVTGVGPKQGLRILSDLTPSEVRNAVIGGNEKELSRAKGIGPKLASRIVLELRDRIQKLRLDDETTAVPIGDRMKTEALLALRVLGYTDQESRRAVESAFEADGTLRGKAVEDVIKAVLARMARG